MSALAHKALLWEALMLSLSVAGVALIASRFVGCV